MNLFGIGLVSVRVGLGDFGLGLAVLLLLCIGGVGFLAWIWWPWCRFWVGFGWVIWCLVWDCIGLYWLWARCLGSC